MKDRKELEGWKELDVNNVPGDILTGPYIFEYLNLADKWTPTSGDNTDILSLAVHEGETYRYRRFVPKVKPDKQILFEGKLEAYKMCRELLQEYETVAEVYSAVSGAIIAVEAKLSFYE